jgi:hypothetical protein
MEEPALEEEEEEGRGENVQQSTPISLSRPKSASLKTREFIEKRQVINNFTN